MGNTDTLLDDISELVGSGAYHKIMQREEDFETNLATSIHAQLILAETYFEVGLYNKSNQKLDEIKDLVSTVVEKARYRILKIQTLSRLGMIDEAQAVVDSCKDDCTEDHLLQSRFLQSCAIMELFRGNYDGGLDYLEQASKYENIIDKKLKQINNIRIMDLQGFILYFDGEFRKSLEIIDKAIEQARQIEHDFLLAHLLIISGNNHQELRDLDLAIQMNKEAMDVSQRINYHLGIASSNGNLSSIYMSIGYFQEAIHHVQKAIEIDAKNKNLRNLAKGYEVLGFIHMNQGNLDDALVNQEKSLELRKMVKNDIEIAISYQDLALIHYYKGNLQYGKELLDQSLELLDKSKNLHYYSNSLYILILTNLELGKLEEAKYSLEELKLLSALDQSPLLELREKMAEALYLKASNRPSRIFNAQSIFEQIASEEIIDHEISIMALFNLCELQILELEMVDQEQSIEILTEIRENITKLMQIASMNNSNFIMIRALLLQSRIELLQEPKNALQFVERAEKVMREHNINHMQSHIYLHREMIQMETKNRQDNPTDMKSMIDRLNIHEYANMLSRQREETSMFLHDISNLLQLNLSYASILRFDDSLSKISSEYIDSIEKTGVEIKNLIETLRDIMVLNQQEATFEYHQIPPRILIEKNQQKLAKLMQENGLELQIDDQIGDLELPIANRMLRVVDILLTYSFTHSPLNHSIAVKLAKDEKRWKLEIAHFGKSLDLQGQLDLFTRLQLDKEGKTKGFGLDLVFCHSVVSALGGHIDIHSPVPGDSRGLCFEIHLPI